MCIGSGFGAWGAGEEAGIALEEMTYAGRLLSRRASRALRTDVPHKATAGISKTLGQGSHVHGLTGLLSVHVLPCLFCLFES